MYTLLNTGIDTWNIVVYYNAQVDINLIMLPVTRQRDKLTVKLRYSTRGDSHD